MILDGLFSLIINTDGSVRSFLLFTIFYFSFIVLVDAVELSSFVASDHCKNAPFSFSLLILVVVIEATPGSHKMKPSANDEHDLENGKSEKNRERTPRNSRVVKVNNQALLSGIAYCLSSCGMILVNKFVLSSYNFNAGISLMLYQVIGFP